MSVLSKHESVVIMIMKLDLPCKFYFLLHPSSSVLWWHYFPIIESKLYGQK